MAPLDCYGEIPHGPALNAYRIEIDAQAVTEHAFRICDSPCIIKAIARRGGVQDDALALRINLALRVLNDL